MADDEQQQPSDEELFEELKRLEVSDVLVQTLFTVSSLGYHKLAQKDLDQARLAIEALRALLPIVEGHVEEQVLRDFRQATSNLQLAYADAAKGDAGS